MKITLLGLLLTGSVLAQTAPGLTPMLPPPNNPTVQPSAEPIRAVPVVSVQPARPAGSAALTQWHGADGGSADLETTVARNQQQWASLWQRINGTPPRALDIATEMGVMVQLGERPTGGYQVRLLRSFTENGRYVVEYSEVAPAPDRFVTQALTQPWVIAVVPASELPVVFRMAKPGRP